MPDGLIILNSGDKIQGDASAAAVIDYTIHGLDNNCIRRLADGQLPNATGDLYTSDSVDVVSAIILVNTDTAARTVNLFLLPSGGTARRLIPKDMILGAGYSLFFDGAKCTTMNTSGQVVGGYSLHAADHRSGGSDDLLSAPGAIGGTTPAAGSFTDLSMTTQAISDNAIVTVDQIGAADNDYAKFTANGIEGRSYAEVRSDLNVEDGAEANNIPDADALDLTDGGDTTLHYHATDRARANHTGTQTASTISDFDEAAQDAVGGRITNYHHNLMMSCDGIVTSNESTGQVTWSDTIRIIFNRTDGDACANTIAASNFTLTDGQFAYVDLSETDGTAVTVSVATVTSDAASNFITFNRLVLAYRNAASDHIVPVHLPAGLISISDTAYGSGWDGVTTVAPSKNAVYDEMETRFDKNDDNTQADGKYIATDKIRARDGDGLYLVDDAGKGIFIKDGGRVGIGTPSPGAALEVTTSGGVNYTRTDGGTFTLLSANSGTTPFTVNLTATAPLIADFQDSGSSVLAVANGGNVGIGTTTPTNGNCEVVGDIYASGDVSALTFTDRTPHFEGDALAEILKISGIKGEIDHSTLPEFVRSQHKKIIWEEVELEEVTDHSQAFDTVTVERDKIFVTETEGKVEKKKNLIEKKQVPDGYVLDSGEIEQKFRTEHIYEQESVEEKQLKADIYFDDETGRLYKKVGEGEIFRRDGKVIQRNEAGIEIEERRDLGAMISMLVVAVQQLSEK